MTETTRLGMRWGGKDAGRDGASRGPVAPVNTRYSLWPERWPAIALQECIDRVESAPPELRAEVKRDLPCKTCPEAPRCLNAKRKEIGALMYSQEILTDPRSDEASLFSSTVLEPLKMPTESLVPFWRPPFSREHEYVVVQAWDIAWSERVGGDWLAFMCGYVHLPSGQRRILDIERWQQKSFGQQIELIKAKHAQFAADLVVVESNAAQVVWKQQVAATSSVPVVAHAVGGEKTSLANGVPSILLYMENRKYEFPTMEGSYHSEMMDAFLSELEAFGWNDGKLEGIGEHDDLVMAFWHLHWGMTRYTREGMTEYHRGVQDGRML